MMVANFRRCACTLLWLCFLLACIADALKAAPGPKALRAAPGSTDEKSAAEIRAAAEKGDAQAQLTLGDMYAEGEGVPASAAEAVKWYRKAAEQGVVDAQLTLGHVYRSSPADLLGLSTRRYLAEGVRADDVEAAKWYRKAGEQGNASAQLNLGLMYAEGEGVAKDAAEAVKWYRMAAEQGHARAQFNLGLMYANGEGVAKDPAEAVRWYRKAAEQGYAAAQNSLGDAYTLGEGVAEDLVEAVRWYRKAAEQGDVDGQFNLAVCYDNGEGVAKDLIEAVKWYRKAAEQGNAGAQFCLGAMYALGEGVPEDDAEAVKWYRKAAEQGHASAQNSLGDAYCYGDGVAKDLTEAVKWYRKAAEQGNASAQFNLALCYENGEGVAKDPAEAVRWYRKAAEQGYARAQFNLAVAYASGKGILTSGAAAADWYYRAGLSYLKDEQPDEALRCVERIQDLKKVLKLTVPNLQLADQLLQAVYGPGGDQPESRGEDRLSGTAWVLDASHMVTSYHVIEGSHSIMVVFPGGAKFELTTEAADRMNDLAILRVSAREKLPPPLPLADQVPKVGAEVFTIGYPHPDLMGRAPKLTNGIISAATGVEDDVRLFQVTVPLQSGNSGGPLLNKQGEVVGVVVAKLNAAQVFKWTGDLPENVNYAVKIAYLRAMMNPNQSKLSGSATSNPRDLESLARNATPSVALVIAE